MKRTLSIIVAFMMATTMASLPAGVFAEENANEGVKKIAGISVVHINPLYEDIIDESDIPLPKKSSSSARSTTTVSEEDYLATEEDAAEVLRDGMEARQETVVLYYHTTDFDQSGQFVYDIFYEATAHTGKPTEGDYLTWQYGGWQCTLGEDSYYRGDDYYLTLKYTMLYYTDARQEAAVDNAVNGILEDLDLDGKSNYRKSKAIYDYICSNVTYDHTNLENEEYKLKHTAYAAFIDETAVCQGYALMFYRLALEAGLDARIVAGYGVTKINPVTKEPHGWNIVKVGNLYYNLDSTWDADATPTEHDWFLKGAGEGDSDNPFDAFDETHMYVTHDADGIAMNPTLSLSDYSRSQEDYVYAGEQDISLWDASLEYAAVTYDGSQKKPKVEIPGLTQGTDFTVAYADNTNAGTATVTIKGIGDYKGTVTKTFKITPATIESSTADISLSAYSYTYNGSARKPIVTVKFGGKTLTNGMDFIVSYSNNTNPGTATVTVTGKGNYTGSLSKSFAIKKLNQTISGTAKFNKAYGNKAFKLGASAKGKLTYKSSNSKIAAVSSAGKVTIKNTGKVTITISAAATSTYNAAVKKVTINISPKKVASVKAKSSKKKTAVISWKKDTRATGYQIVYSTDKKFKKNVKKVNISKNKTVKKTVSKLKSKKTYYVKVRAYKKAGSTKLYGAYSAVKTVKIK